MTRNRHFLVYVFALCTSLIISSCSTVRPYQRIYLDDSEMAVGAGHSERFELKALHYREGGVNSVKNKASGGCGCN